MSTYYVRKGGSDTTGNGSTDTPWLTINKALSTVSSDGGHTINVGPGTYAETGRLIIPATVFTATVIVQSETGTGVTVTGTETGGSGAMIRPAGTCGRVTFRNLSFVMQAGAAYGIYLYLNGQSATNIAFDSCSFSTDSGTANQVLFIPETYNTTSISVAFDSCTFTDVTSGGVQTMLRFISDNAASRPITVRLSNCSGSMLNNSRALLEINGATNFLVDGGTWTSGTGFTMIIGNNTSTGVAMNGAIKNATISCTNSNHTLLIGGGCNGVVVRGCHINAGDHAIAAKATNFVITECVIRSVGKSVPAVIFKGASNFLFAGNVIINDSSSGCIANYDGAAVTVSKATIVHNTFFCRGSDRAVYWDAAGDAGGNIVDGNIYDIATATYDNLRGYGTILGVACKTLADVKTAWATYSLPGNEATATDADTQYLAKSFTQ